MADKNKAVIAVDAHGGDHGLDVTLPATLDALEADHHLEIRMLGRQADFDQFLAAKSVAGINPQVKDRFDFVAVETELAMDVSPIAALRRGKGSSLWEAIALVANGEADACVSGGSTGAMMALGVRLSGMLTGIERPVLMSYVPNASGFTGALDLGANLSVSERQLVQFAVMGSITAEHVDGIENPRVGLLNVGHEDNKGPVIVQAAHALLKEMPLNYVGFVEGNDLYAGSVDVAVCDGFTGNLVLKSNEGLARMITSQMKNAMRGSFRGRLGAWIARPALKSLLVRLDPSAHNGAPLLGLRGNVIKSHGHANKAAFTQAIFEAAKTARKKLPKRIDSLIQQYNLEA
ncbi:MAG TPA: phosphate acyltransferase PlsX [Xanthomonadales bacterium]|nr:phosphate acyltransferase PlsX [Xanthomonadales bacterium]